MPKNVNSSTAKTEKFAAERQCYTTKEVLAMLGYNRNAFCVFLKKHPKQGPPYIRLGKKGAYRFPIKTFNAWLERKPV